MKESKLKKLLEAYKAGETTLEEERFLFEQAKEAEPSWEAWSTFVKNNEIATPKDLNDRLWESFEPKTLSSRKKVVVMLSAAATVLVLVALAIGNLGQDELSYSEKEALLNEALELFPETIEEVTEREVIYENEMITVYTASE
ncbi:MAG: hypothetical protein AAGD88_06660 [Bacteroidota bacterium]